MKTFFNVLAAASLGASMTLTPAALAQTQQPKTLTGKAAGAAKHIEGRVTSIDHVTKMVTLQDGTTLVVTDAAMLKDLTLGGTVKASYEETGGRKVAISLEEVE